MKNRIKSIEEINLLIEQKDDLTKNLHEQFSINSIIVPKVDGIGNYNLQEWMNDMNKKKMTYEPGFGGPLGTSLSVVDILVKFINVTKKNQLISIGVQSSHIDEQLKKHIEIVNSTSEELANENKVLWKENRELSLIIHRYDMEKEVKGETKIEIDNTVKQQIETDNDDKLDDDKEDDEDNDDDEDKKIEEEQKDDDLEAIELPEE